MIEYDQLVTRAVEGDRTALTDLVDAIRDRIFGLSIRMLSHPQDAEDATQEILLQIVTHLGSYRAESSFLTWAYRVATNHLLNTRRRSADEAQRNFADFGEQIDRGLAAAASFEAVQTDAVLEQEILLSCTHSMLVCLTREERIAYVLGAIFEVSGDEGAALLDVPAATFRKRLSRGRTRLEAFMRDRCGVYKSSNPCRCKTIGQVALGTKTLSREGFRYTHLEVVDGHLAKDEAQQFADLLDAAMVLKTQPEYATPKATIRMLDELINRTTSSRTPEGN